MSEATEEVQVPQDGETVNILDRGGAIAVLREIREDIRDLNRPTNLSEEDRIGRDVEALVAMVFGLATMLSGVLGDPELAREIQADLDEADL